MHPLLPILKALADETRLGLLHLLLTQDLCGKALARRLGVSEAAVSQHLKILRAAGLVQGEKRGYWTHYTVRKEIIEQVIDELSGFLGKAVIPTVQCRRTDPTQKNLSKKEVRHMCCGPCQQPDKLKGKPEACTLVQIRECHGEVTNHPCHGKKKDEKVSSER